MRDGRKPKTKKAREPELASLMRPGTPAGPRTDVRSPQLDSSDDESSAQPPSRDDDRSRGRTALILLRPMGLLRRWRAVEPKKKPRRRGAIRGLSTGRKALRLPTIGEASVVVRVRGSAVGFCRRFDCTELVQGPRHLGLHSV